MFGDLYQFFILFLKYLRVIFYKYYLLYGLVNSPLCREFLIQNVATELNTSQGVRYINNKLDGSLKSIENKCKYISNNYITNKLVIFMFLFNFLLLRQKFKKGFKDRKNALTLRIKENKKNKHQIPPRCYCKMCNLFGNANM